jgi:peptidyl-prolyl cis-trans isomerase A (cyclophilin A)
MTTRFGIFAALLFALPSVVHAQTTTDPVTPTVAAPQPLGLVRVVLTTSAGVIALDIETKRAPITAANFLRYVDQKRLDGTTFYRSMKLGENQGLVQGGARGDVKRVLKPIAHEPTSQTGLKHVAGAISMARVAPGSATADFFILASPIPGLDADPKGPGDNAGYAVFGLVVEGMEVIQKILNAPKSPTLGVGIMKGQMLAVPVKIVTARRLSPVAKRPAK